MFFPTPLFFRYHLPLMAATYQPTSTARIGGNVGRAGMIVIQMVVLVVVEVQMSLLMRAAAAAEVSVGQHYL
jgi:hypothetical protein